MIFINNGRKVVEITKQLKKIRSQEPKNDKFTPIIRALIVGYEIGDIQRYVKIRAQENLSDGIKKGYEQNAKLGLADAVIQLRLLCMDLGWNFDDLQYLGLKHLKERFVELKRDGFAEG